jgi:phospholipid-transporting ATPase
MIFIFCYRETLFAIALCHTIITEKNSEGEIVFNASSPDELALINWSKYCGCEFKGVDKNNNMIVEFKNFSYKFQVLQVLEFNSSRLMGSFIKMN